MLRWIGAATAAVCFCACVHGPSVVARALPLRRVVVFRNGVGYFERGGRAEDDQLAFRVRERDVGDFLATLAVTDRNEGVVRAATFPATAVDDRREGRRTVTLALEHRGRDVTVGYTVETPIWRPSYRVVFGEGGRARLQLWGIVQNRSGEDWNEVRLSLVAGAPVAFRSVLGDGSVAPRPIVDDRGDVIEAVPTAGASISADGAVERAPCIDDGRGGCRAGDEDHDGIPDVADRCPYEPETYNGMEDDDGCPDRGHILVTSSALRILDAIYFTENSDAIETRSQPILDAIARTLSSNPDIVHVVIEGHADVAERNGDARAAELLSTARARAVFAALVRHGVEIGRLETFGFGSARPREPNGDAAARAGNRRVEFRVTGSDDTAAASARSAPPMRARVTPSTPDTTPSRALLANVASVAGGARYDLSHPVHIPDGSATMVLLLTEDLAAERTFLFSPEDSVPASAAHPYRVLRFRNASVGLLERGPMAIFDANTFVGQGLMASVPQGAIATVPFALERGIAVDVASSQSVEGERLQRVARDDVRIERFDTRRTTFTVRNGTAEPVRVFVRLALPDGFDLASPPEGVERTDAGALVPIEVPAAATVARTLVLRSPLSVHASWADDAAAAAIGAFLRDGHPNEPAASALRAALDVRTQIAARTREREGIEPRRGDLAREAEETRVNLLTIEHHRTAGLLRAQLLARLSRIASESEQLTQRAVALDAELSELRIRFSTAIRAIDFDVATQH